ncbi:MAG: PaaI family thioesterase, partial [Pseudomonadota bacterium]
MTESTPFPDRTAAGYNRRGEGLLPGHMDIQIRHVEHGRISAQLTINDHHRAPNGYLHAGTVVTLADTAAGYGCSA